MATQNKTKHTGGEWKVYPPQSGKVFGYEVRTRGGAFICQCSHHPDKRKEAEANAKLIAAAPLLLEALQNLSDYVMQSTDAIPPQLVNALTVIKKATN